MLCCKKVGVINHSVYSRRLIMTSTFWGDSSCKPRAPFFIFILYRVLAESEALKTWHASPNVTSNGWKCACKFIFAHGGEVLNQNKRNKLELCARWTNCRLTAVNICLDLWFLIPPVPSSDPPGASWPWPPAWSLFSPVQCGPHYRKYTQTYTQQAAIILNRSDWKTLEILWKSLQNSGNSVKITDRHIWTTDVRLHWPLSILRTPQFIPLQALEKLILVNKWARLALLWNGALSYSLNTSPLPYLGNTMAAVLRTHLYDFA